MSSDRSVTYVRSAQSKAMSGVYRAAPPPDIPKRHPLSFRTPPRLSFRTTVRNPTPMIRPRFPRPAPSPCRKGGSRGMSRFLPSFPPAPWCPPSSAFRLAPTSFHKFIVERTCPQSCASRSSHSGSTASQAIAFQNTVQERGAPPNRTSSDPRPQTPDPRPQTPDPRPEITATPALNSLAQDPKGIPKNDTTT